MLIDSIKEAHAGKIEVFEYSYQLSLALFDIWSLAPQNEVETATVLGETSFSAGARAPIARVPTFWAIAFTPTFQKSIAAIDKKLQGRILLAISEIAEEPITLVGDTKKPLIGELKGLWRYRLGDYRLIYQPNEKTLKVILLEFTPRGSSYG